jgi:hypothetical protein
MIDSPGRAFRANVCWLRSFEILRAEVTPTVNDTTHDAGIIRNPVVRGVLIDWSNASARCYLIPRRADEWKQRKGV